MASPGCWLDSLEGKRPLSGLSLVSVTGAGHPLVNERAVRGSAGTLLAFGAAGFALAFFRGETQFAQSFILYFVLDLGLRVSAGPQWSPTMIAAAIITRKQTPEWVGLAQKEVAWWLGIALATLTCLLYGSLGADLQIVLALCGVCLLFLFLESSFGICIGCMLAPIIIPKAPRLCSGDSCIRQERDQKVTTVKSEGN